MGAYTFPGPFNTKNKEMDNKWEEEVRTGAPWTQDGTAMLSKIRLLLAAQKQELAERVRGIYRTFTKYDAETEEEYKYLEAYYNGFNEAIEAAAKVIEE